MLVETVEVSDKYRIVIAGAVRKAVPLRVGQKVLELPLGDSILVVPLPENPDKILRKYLGDVHLNRGLRKKAEALMLGEVS